MLLPITFLAQHNFNINEAGLQVLTWVKQLKGEAVDLDSLKDMNRPMIQHDVWTDLLQKHVDVEGKVNYKGFATDNSSLSAYLNLLSANPPGENWSEADQLAYWINAYNAFTVKLILDHYPLKSIKEISTGLPMINSPWDLKFFEIGGIPFDLNTIEHEILRKRFDEPRIHFAINCASISCPKLRSEAYTAEKLELQLHEQTIDFLRDPIRNQIDAKETRLSSIFNWFQGDFERQTNLIGFIAPYVPEINPENEIEYLEYDWGLNE